MKILWIGICLVIGASATTIGGFDNTRGGVMSVQSSASLANFRIAVMSAFPGVTFTSAATLTTGFLGGVDVLLVGSATGGVTATAALSSSEQTALTSFVSSGGTALIFVDNDSFDVNAVVVNASFISPFGLHVTGTLNSAAVATPVVAQSANPVLNGPFGVVSQLQTFVPGYFDNTGGSTVLARLDLNSQPMLTYLTFGTGHVVFFSDVNLLLDATRTAGDGIAVLNAMALQPSNASVPEPMTSSILGAGIATLFYANRRRIRSEHTRS